MNYKLNLYEHSLCYIFDNINIFFIERFHILVKNSEFIIIEFISTFKKKYV